MSSICSWRFIVSSRNPIDSNPQRLEGGARKELFRVRVCEVIGLDEHHLETQVTEYNVIWFETKFRGCFTKLQLKVVSVREGRQSTVILRPISH